MSRNLRVAILSLVLLFIALPAFAQHGKTATRVDGATKPREEKRSQPARTQPRVVEKDQERGKVEREAETRPRADQNIRTEGETRPGNETRKALPIIEGERKGQTDPIVPGRVNREKNRDEPRPQKIRPDDAGERVRGTLERFRRDLVDGDTRALSGMLSDRSRIKITLDSRGINDSFSRGQAQYILREYLSSSDHRNLSFSRFRVSSSDGENAYGVGKMRMRDRKSGKIMDRTVFVSMAREGESWAIREIRITE